MLRIQNLLVLESSFFLVLYENSDHPISVYFSGSQENDGFITIPGFNFVPIPTERQLVRSTRG